MPIRALMLVKNERDIIDATIRAAGPWCDHIYVFDNGSTDGTWERIRELARTQRSIVPFKQEASPFSQALRGEIFREFRGSAAHDDWWCILDADEIYIDDPRAFLGRVPSGYGEVCSASYQYYFTDVDAARYEGSSEEFLAADVENRLRYYLNNWSESRFIRHHAGLVWPEDREGRPVGKRPVGLRRRYPDRIRLKHYQYRSPEQIQRRMETRSTVTQSYRHEQQEQWLQHLFGDQAPALVVGGAPSWRDRVVPASLLHLDRGDGAYVANEPALPPIPRDPLRLRELSQQAASLRWRVRRGVRQLL